MIPKIEIAWHPGQKKIIAKYNKYKYFVCCFGRRWGKTKMVTNLCIKKIQKKDFKIAYAVPYYSKIKAVWDELNLKLQPIIKNNSKAEKIIELLNGSSITFLTLDSPGAFRQYEFDLVIIDECSMIRDFEHKWLYEIKPTLINRQGKCFFISTPQGTSNYFSKLYNNALLGTDPEWIAFSGPTYENPTIPLEEQIKLKAMDINDPVVKQEILAQIIPGQGNPFGDIKLIDPIIVVDSMPVVFGVDLASRVDFTSIVGLNQSNQICSYHNFQLPWTETKNKIKEIVGNTPCIADRTGVGDVIIQDLKQMGLNQIEEYVLTHQSKQTLIQGLSTAIKNNKIGIPNNLSKLITELNEFEYKYENGSLYYGTQPGHDDDVISTGLAWLKANNITKIDPGLISVGQSMLKF